MQIRPATSDDAPQISDLLRSLIAAGKRTSPGDLDFVRRRHLDDPDRILCSVAVEGGPVLGFQSLTRAAVGNPYGTPEGWGIIGTHVSPGAARRGIGARLFEATRLAAVAAGLEHIEACIGEENIGAQAYYGTMGFRTCRTGDGTICKRYRFLPP